MNHEQLRALCLAATPGPRYQGVGDDWSRIYDKRVWFDEDGARHGDTTNLVVVSPDDAFADAAYIAAMSPDQTLELLDEIEASDYTTSLTKDILDNIALQLKGEPKPLHLHGWQDLPELLRVKLDENERLRELLRDAFYALDLSRDDVCECLNNAIPNKGFERWDRRIEAYSAQLVQHDNTLDKIKKELE